MKSVLGFLRTTLTGGIIFLLPITLLIIILRKAFQLLERIAMPVTSRVPDFFFGLDGSTVIGIVMLVFVCFIGGLIFRSGLIKRWVSKLEDNVLCFLPGYTLVKSIAADAVGEKVEKSLHPVMIQDGDSWNPGFLVEATEDHCTVFIPECPRLDSGEVKILPASMVKRINVPNNQASLSLRNYGKGALQWLNKFQQE